VESRTIRGGIQKKEREKEKKEKEEKFSLKL